MIKLRLRGVYNLPKVTQPGCSGRAQPQVQLVRGRSDLLGPYHLIFFHLLQKDLSIFLVIPSWLPQSPQSLGVLGSGTAPAVCVYNWCQLVLV